MDKKFICKTCNRYYKSYQSLWNHNKKFHSINNHNITNHNHTDNQNITINNHNKYNCKYCNKQFNFNQNKWRHEKKCNKTLIKKYNDLKEENELLKEEFKKER